MQIINIEIRANEIVLPSVFRSDFQKSGIEAYIENDFLIIPYTRDTVISVVVNKKINMCIIQIGNEEVQLNTIF